MQQQRGLERRQGQRGRSSEAQCFRVVAKLEQIEGDAFDFWVHRVELWGCIYGEAYGHRVRSLVAGLAAQVSEAGVWGGCRVGCLRPRLTALGAAAAARPPALRHAVRPLGASLRGERVGVAGA